MKCKPEGEHNLPIRKMAEAASLLADGDLLRICSGSNKEEGDDAEESLAGPQTIHYRWVQLGDE